jgi:hypothetical protein
MEDLIEPIVDLAAGVVSSSDSPKGCLFAFIMIAVVVGIIALVVWLV